MRILALDSASAGCSVAIWQDGAVLARQSTDAARAASEALVPMLARALADAGVGFRDLDRLAVTVGPGHFTGLRAGLAAMRGLALATRLPVVGVTTLEAVAAGTEAAGRHGRRLLVALDSKRPEPFLQMFDASLAPLHAPVSMSVEAFSAGVGPGTDVIVAGDAAPALAAALACAGHVAAVVTPARPDAADVAALAARRTPLAEPVRPFYLHPPAVATPAADDAR